MDPADVQGHSNIICDTCNQKNTAGISPIVNKLVHLKAAQMVANHVIKKVSEGGEEDEDFPASSSNKLHRIGNAIKNIAVGQFSNSDFSNWECIGNLNEAYLNNKLSKYNNCIGLYMHKINDEIMYIGRAIEYNNGGFRKRLADYCRDSSSARKHTSGQIIYQNRKNITTYLLIVGNDEEAKEKTIILEKEYINKYNPPWNKQLKTKEL